MSGEIALIIGIVTVALVAITGYLNWKGLLDKEKD